VQVLFLAVLIDALHAALENRVVALDCVGVNIAARPFVFLMLDAAMLGKLFANLFALVGLVRRLSRRRLVRRIGTISATLVLPIWNDRAEPPRSTSVSP
jgi:hypothetical protein